MNESQRRRRLAEAANDDYDSLMRVIGEALAKMPDAQRITAMISSCGMVISLASPTQEDASNLVGCFAEDLRDFIARRWEFFEQHKLFQAQRSMGERAMAEAIEAEGLTKQ
jgi:hypothetical protein